MNQSILSRKFRVGLSGEANSKYPIKTSFSIMTTFHLKKPSLLGKHMCIHAHTHAHPCVHIHMHTDTHTHTHIHPCRHTPSPRTTETLNGLPGVEDI